MQPVTLIEKIVERLREARYEKASHPLKVADMAFDFDAVLAGPQPQTTLVLVAQAQADDMRALWRRMKALTLILERSDSHRPLSLVVVSAQSEPPGLARLRQLCRVLVISPDVDEPALRSALAALLPLALPEPFDLSQSRPAALRARLDEKLRRQLADDATRELVTDLLHKAARGKAGVEKGFLDHLRRNSEIPGETP